MVSRVAGWVVSYIAITYQEGYSYNQADGICSWGSDAECINLALPDCLCQGMMCGRIKPRAQGTPHLQGKGPGNIATVSEQDCVRLVQGGQWRLVQEVEGDRICVGENLISPVRVNTQIPHLQPAGRTRFDDIWERCKSRRHRSACPLMLSIMRVPTCSTSL